MRGDPWAVSVHRSLLFYCPRLSQPPLLLHPSILRFTEHYTGACSGRFEPGGQRWSKGFRAGRTVSISARPGGGVWKTDDAGQTWTSLFDRGGSSAIGAIAIAPSNPNIIYVGGGQPEPRYDVQSGRGVYKSIDGGKTWIDLGLADTRYIGRIWISPTDPDIVVVAAVGHFFGASNARESTGQPTAARPGHTRSRPAPSPVPTISSAIPPTHVRCSPRPGTRGSGRGRVTSPRFPGRAAASGAPMTRARTGGGFPAAAGQAARSAGSASLRHEAAGKVRALRSHRFQAQRRPLAVRRRRRALAPGELPDGLRQLLFQPSDRRSA